MPLDYDILKEAGTHAERLRELFSAKTTDTTPDADKERVELDEKVRRTMEDIMAARVDDAIFNSLRFAHLYQSADLAWDSSTITQYQIPLVMYAQKRIKVEACTKELDRLGCKDSYVKKAPDGKEYIDLPKFCEVSVNLVRSIITRRVAAQSSRFSNLSPFFKYDPRNTSEVSRLRGDVLSQASDIMAEQYGYRDAQIGNIRDMFMYGHSVSFPRCAWERDVEWTRSDLGKAFTPDNPDGPIPKETRVVREGVSWVTPHPSRVFYDHAYPITSINSDSGCEWFGFWDVCRYGDILDNPDYFNRDAVGYSPHQTSVFTAYSAYFTQYYTAIVPPMPQNDLASNNDRKNNISKYTNAMRDAAVFICHFYWKLKPNQWRLGNYPWPIWLHLVVCNGRTVVKAEIMPSCPGAVYSYNESPQRLANLSMAHELMPYQDQLSNLFRQLLESVKRDLFSVCMLNTDIFPATPEGNDALATFRSAMSSDNIHTGVARLEVSFQKLKELGIDPNPMNVFHIVRADANPQLAEIYNAINQVIQLSERLMALSSQEQAQLSQRETSATEIQVIATTTENVYAFISNAIDEGRAAQKRYIYDAMISFGSKELYVPVAGRYRMSTIKAAGFDAIPADGDPTIGTSMDQDPDAPRNYVIVANKANLVDTYNFNSRDGADRSSNQQAAQTLTQLLQVVTGPAVIPMLSKGQLANFINAIIRASGTGVDFSVEPAPGEENLPVMAPPQPTPATASVPQAPAAPGMQAPAPVTFTAPQAAPPQQAPLS